MPEAGVDVMADLRFPVVKLRQRLMGFSEGGFHLC